MGHGTHIVVAFFFFFSLETYKIGMSMKILRYKYHADYFGTVTLMHTLSPYEFLIEKVQYTVYTLLSGMHKQ